MRKTPVVLLTSLYAEGVASILAFGLARVGADDQAIVSGENSSSWHLALQDTVISRE